MRLFNKHRMETVEGDLLNFCTPFTFIAQQCNCNSRTPKHLSAQIFKRFPEANIYRGDVKRVPGNIIIRGRVVNILSQNSPGKARTETYLQRREWLRQGLEKILENKSITEIYFPWGMSCGAAGDNWDKVLPIFEEFHDKMTQDGRIAKFVKLPSI